MDDFLSRRRRQIEQQRAFIQRMERLYRGIPLTAYFLKRLRVAGLTKEEIVGLLRHVAAELEKAEDRGTA